MGCMLIYAPRTAHERSIFLEILAAAFAYSTWKEEEEEEEGRKEDHLVAGQ